MHELHEHERSDEVVQRCDDGRETHAPLEPNREINQGDEERDRERDHSVAAELASDSGADCFASYDSGRVTVRRLEGGFDSLGHRARARFLRSDLGRFLRANGELSLRSELRNLGAGDARLIQSRSQRADIERPGKLNLHERAAGKLDAVVDRSPDVGNQSDQKEGDREPCGPLPPANEIVVGIMKYSQHQMLRVCVVAGLRLSQNI